MNKDDLNSNNYTALITLLGDLLDDSHHNYDGFWNDAEKFGLEQTTVRYYIDEGYCFCIENNIEEGRQENDQLFACEWIASALHEGYRLLSIPDEDFPIDWVVQQSGDMWDKSLPDDHQERMKLVKNRKELIQRLMDLLLQEWAHDRKNNVIRPNRPISYYIFIDPNDPKKRHLLDM